MHWWRRRESNSRPQALRPRLYMLILSICLVDDYPKGREDHQRAWMSFNESTPGVLHRDPVWVDSSDPRVRARNGLKALRQVFKLLVRSCHHWQLKVCNQFYELNAARHAPWVLLPASKPGRPQSCITVTILPAQGSAVAKISQDQRLCFMMRCFWRPHSLSFTTFRLSCWRLPFATPISTFTFPRER